MLYPFVLSSLLISYPRLQKAMPFNSLSMLFVTCVTYGRSGWFRYIHRTCEVWSNNLKPLQDYKTKSSFMRKHIDAELISSYTQQNVYMRQWVRNFPCIRFYFPPEKTLLNSWSNKKLVHWHHFRTTKLPPRLASLAAETNKMSSSKWYTKCSSFHEMDQFTWKKQIPKSPDADYEISCLRLLCP